MTIPNLSAALVCTNEIKVIEPTLQCLSKLTDEIVVVDGFSTDGTVEMLKNYNCKIYQNSFDNHRDQKNRAIEKCTNEWVLLLDSDEYVDEKLFNNIQVMMNNPNGIDAFGIPRKNYLDGDGPRDYPDIQTRLFRNYVRHHGHPFHHRSDLNAKKHIWTREYGCIIHEKNLERQKKQNRMYYFFEPTNYEGVPIGAEDVVIDKNVTSHLSDANIAKDFFPIFGDKR